MRTAWLQLDEVLRQKLWPRMMLAALDSSSAVFSAFVQATYDPSWSPIYVVEDIVRLIMLRVRLFGSAEQAAEKQELVDTAVFLLQLVPPKNLALEQDIIGRIVSLSTIDRATDLFNYLETHDYRFNSQTLLQFASRFAKSNEHKVIAAENLCYAARHRDFDINSPSAASVCTSLLTIEKGHPFPDGAAAPDELFKILLEAGFQPNLFTMTALMRNFCVRGHLKTAWTIFDLLLERGIEPDAHVYSILLKASKKELDISSIRLIMSTVHSKKLWSPIILNDFLDILYMHKERMAEPNSEGIFPFGRRQRKTNNAFRPMLQVYAKFFRLAPLQKFWPFPLEDRLSWMGAEPGQKFATPITELAAALMPQPDHLLIEPDTITLTLMLAANIRSLDQPDAMLRTYNRFLNMLDARDPLALQLIERHGTLVYDIFLRGLLQFRKCLDPAVRLVKRMLQLSKDEHLEHGKIIRHPPPSVHTWTIMVNGFKNHKLPHGAVSMIRLMMTHGMQPNLHTWNALIAAFARAGNARGAVKAMRYLEASGLQPDQHTLDAFGHLRRRARQHAVALLEASRKEPVEPDKLLLQLSLSAKQDPEEKKLGFRKQPQFETDRPITKLPPLGEAQQLAEWDRETTQRDLSRRLQFNPRIRKLGLNDNLPLGEAGVYPKPPPRTHAARHLKLDREAAYSAEDIES
ncbi:uncharacterized protein BCR38DRAFT_351128 [Pseudomassariella vexata]|uniref:Pentatricopeptide repeat domain-containing protein n=1 Tax=Pseudomassariella vexata TaxID=1141098 RepID=A0A1Y2DLG0_9PEZI|nr:uncharacterized protein BCR38DRAFT_351128 [Pseudomassariella vexata]ORY59565.1 hypothetical protein BCR38DRAFT_351128 [Pseudomassariella vexata]